MGRLKRKKPIVTRGRKTQDKAKIAKSDETLTNKDATKREALAQSNGSSKKIAKIARKAPPKAGEQASVVKQPTFWTKAVQFLQEARMELKRVTWPSRKETIASTVVVIVLVFIISFFLGIVDFGLSNLVGVVLR